MSRFRKPTDISEKKRDLQTDTAERLEAIVEAAERAAESVIDDAEAQARRYLAQARFAAEVQAADIEFREMSVYELPSLGETFDGITCVSDVLNHLPTLEEWEQAFRSFHRHLNPGGWLFFDSMTCHGLAEQDAYSTNDRASKVLLLGVIWEPATRRSTMKITSFVPVEGTFLWERATETITEWGQPVQEIYDRLARAGFQPPERLWPQGEDPEKEERLAVLVRR